MMPTPAETAPAPAASASASAAVPNGVPANVGQTSEIASSISPRNTAPNAAPSAASVSEPAAGAQPASPSIPHSKSVKFLENESSFLTQPAVPVSSVTHPRKPSIKSSPSSISETARAAIRQAGGVVSDDIQPGAPAGGAAAVAGTDGTGKGTASSSTAEDATKPKPPVERPTGKPMMDIYLDQVVLGLFCGWILLLLLLVWLLKPSEAYFSVFTGIGFGLSLAFVFLYYLNRKNKLEVNQVLGTDIGLKGLQNLLGNLPSWLSYTEKEKMEWFNSMLEEIWPYVDKAVSKIVKEQTEAVFENTLKQFPIPTIKSITFKHLTFGDAPFRIESIWANEDTSKFVELEMGIRWCGDSNIALAIETPGIADSNVLCPRVTDIAFSGNVIIRLQPLMDTIPGFGAMMVTFLKPPLYKYRMDFSGAYGGASIASMIQPFIKSVADSQINNMLVWPQRLVLPILLDPSIKLELERMAYRAQGLLKVTIVKATGLRDADAMGKSDPVAEMTTDGQYIAQTKVINSSLNPEWNETFWLVVHEPKSQEMRLWISDVDLFSATELISGRFNNAVGTKEFLGRTIVKLGAITSQEPHAVEQWYNLGEGEWSRPEGPGKGCGRVLLKSEYRSLENFRKEEVETAMEGILSLKIIKCNNLSTSKKPMTIYAVAKCGGQRFETSPITSKTKEHLFLYKSMKDFYHTRFDADVQVKIYEKGIAGQNDEVGVVEIPLTDVAVSEDVNILSGLTEPGYYERELTLEEADQGTITIQLRYIPHF